MRSYRATKRLNEILNKENTLLSRLFHKADILQQLDTEISTLLPPNLASKARVANINRYEVVIHISSAALLTRLRLQQQTLKQKINQRFTWANIEKVIIKVRPEKMQPSKPEKDKPHRSDKIATTVELAAKNCNSPVLKASLSNLAVHIRNKDAH